MFHNMKYLSKWVNVVDIKKKVVKNVIDQAIRPFRAYKVIDEIHFGYILD